MLIRETTLADVQGMAEVRRQLFPWITASVAAQEAWLVNAPAAMRTLRLSAEVDGTIAGFGMAQLNTMTTEEHAGFGTVAVRPDFQRRGIGQALWEKLSTHFRAVGVQRAMGYGKDDPETEAWMARRGIERGTSSRYSMVDPRDLPEVPVAPPSVRLVTITEAGPDAVYALEAAAASDVPGDVPFTILPKADWRKRNWDGVDLSHEASTVALVDGVPAAFTMLEINIETGRAWTSGTGTLREFRGLGLSKLVKSACLRKAAELGVTEAYTANHYGNAPMLAVNDWLGYRVVASNWAYIKDFSGHIGFAAS